MGPCRAASARCLQVEQYQRLARCTWEQYRSNTKVTSEQQGRRETALQAIQRAFHAAAALPQHVRVDHGRGQQNEKQQTQAAQGAAFVSIVTRACSIDTGRLCYPLGVPGKLRSQ